MTFEEACKLNADEMYEACGFRHLISLCFHCKHKKKCLVSQYTDNHDKDEIVTECNFYEEEQ